MTAGGIRIQNSNQTVSDPQHSNSNFQTNNVSEIGAQLRFALTCRYSWPPGRARASPQREEQLGLSAAFSLLPADEAAQRCKEIHS